MDGAKSQWSLAYGSDFFLHQQQVVLVSTTVVSTDAIHQPEELLAALWSVLQRTVVPKPLPNALPGSRKKQKLMSLWYLLFVFFQFMKPTIQCFRNVFTNSYIIVICDVQYMYISTHMYAHNMSSRQVSRHDNLSSPPKINAEMKTFTLKYLLRLKIKADTLSYLQPSPSGMQKSLHSSLPKRSWPFVAIATAATRCR